LALLIFETLSDEVNSKAQYVRQLKKWGFSKSLSEQSWKNIDGRIRKRELEGKESEIYINGTLIPSKKLKKEISRHVRPSFVRERSLGNQISLSSFRNQTTHLLQSPDSSNSRGGRYQDAISGLLQSH